jgi:hypothetical protein
VQNYALGKPRISIERDGAGNDLWYYVHTFDGRLLYRISPTGTRHFYHFDENGNTVLLTSDTGAVIQSYFVAPHGEILNKSGNQENLMVTQAEAGGQNLGDSGTLKLGSTFVDMNTGHSLNSKLQLKAEYATQPSFDGQYGRSLAPGLPITIEKAEATDDGINDWMNDLPYIGTANNASRINELPAPLFAERLGQSSMADENPAAPTRPRVWSTRQRAMRALGIGEGPRKTRPKRFPKGFSLPADQPSPVVESILKEVGYALPGT